MSHKDLSDWFLVIYTLVYKNLIFKGIIKLNKLVNHLTFAYFNQLT